MFSRRERSPRLYESLDLEDIREGRESGTRRIARRATPPPEAAQRHDSQRPTVPVPAGVSVARYLESPEERSSLRNAPKGGTLRLHLTPYAREHAAADGETDDTPGAMLDYLKILGSVDRIPHVRAAMSEILLAKLDHREGFVLSLIDGRSSIDSVLDASPMPTHKTLRILEGLRERNLIEVKDPISPHRS